MAYVGFNLPEDMPLHADCSPRAPVGREDLRRAGGSTANFCMASNGSGKHDGPAGPQSRLGQRHDQRGNRRLEPKRRLRADAFAAEDVEAVVAVAAQRTRPWCGRCRAGRSSRWE